MSEQFWEDRQQPITRGLKQLEGEVVEVGLIALGGQSFTRRGALKGLNEWGNQVRVQETTRQRPSVFSFAGPGFAIREIRVRGAGAPIFTNSNVEEVYSGVALPPSSEQIRLAREGEWELH